MTESSSGYEPAFLQLPNVAPLSENVSTNPRDFLARLSHWKIASTVDGIKDGTLPLDQSLTICDWRSGQCLELSGRQLVSIFDEIGQQRHDHNSYDAISNASTIFEEIEAGDPDYTFEEPVPPPLPPPLRPATNVSRPIFESPAKTHKRPLKVVGIVACALLLLTATIISLLVVFLNPQPPSPSTEPEASKMLIIGALSGHRVIEIYSPKDESQNRQMYSPDPLIGAVAANFGTFLMLAGGCQTSYSAPYFRRGRNSTWFLDLGKYEWTDGPQMSQGHCCAAGALLGELFIVCSGYLKNSSDISGVCESYNSSIGRWERIEDIPEPTGSAVGLAFNKELYILGGFNETGISNSVQRYNPAEHSWSSVTPMQQARATFGAEVFEGGIISCGGVDHFGVLSSCERYNVSLNIWMWLTELNCPNYRLWIVNFEQAILEIGGERSSCNGTERENSVRELSDGKWNEIGALSITWDNLYCVVVVD